MKINNKKMLKMERTGSDKLTASNENYIQLCKPDLEPLPEMTIHVCLKRTNIQNVRH
jgi:hypothetical protein